MILTDYFLISRTALVRFCACLAVRAMGWFEMEGIVPRPCYCPHPATQPYYAVNDIFKR